jgi:hypothetical protein
LKTSDHPAKAMHDMLDIFGLDLRFKPRRFSRQGDRLRSSGAKGCQIPANIMEVLSNLAGLSAHLEPAVRSFVFQHYAA